MKKMLFFIALLTPLSIFCQKDAVFKMEVSSDTAGLDGTLEVVFTIENAKAKKFTPPNFEGFEVQGPSTSSMMSIVNGEMSQKMSYTFYLTPKSKGLAKIGSARVDTEGGVLKTEEKEIVVLEHYEAVAKPKQKRRNFFDDDEEDMPFFRRTPPKPATPTPPPAPEKKKEKYKTEKI